MQTEPVSTQVMEEAVFSTIQAGIVIMDAERHVILNANPAAVRLIGRSKESLVGCRCHRFICPAEEGKCPITDLHCKVDSSERVLLDAEGRRVPILKSVIGMKLDGRECLIECFLDLTERKRTEEALKKAHGELLYASRLAGMAEVATSVLHNVGNVLNSVNVSINLLSDQVRQSRIANLARAAALMREKGAGLGEFLTRDAQGQQLPGYLEQLGDFLLKEQAALLQELQSLRGNVDHINQIVAMQQSYARVAGVSETVRVAELVEDAFKINAGALIRHDVQLIRQYDPNLTPQINVEKHKVLQVLINLIRNAKYACDDSLRPDKRITVGISERKGWVEISVADNGVGIPPENLARIFSHGFTTRKGGHGFGLHSGALAAKEMGGVLRVHSDGPGQGAAFTLELPLRSTGEMDHSPSIPKSNPGTFATAAPVPA